jgi:hypothetical protein
MGVYSARLPTLTMDSGFASSSVLVGIEDASALTIYAPATLTGTITVRCATESSGITGSSNFVDFQSGGADVTFSQGNAVTLVPPGGAYSIILVSSTAEAGRRNFSAVKKFTI